MIKPRLFLCGGAEMPEDASRNGAHVVRLSTFGRDANVNVRLEDVAKVFNQHVSPRLKDLLEIAAYVYTADCATKRGGKWGHEETLEPWPRDFRFVIPVSEPEFWSKSEVCNLLCQMLHFLSDDKYKFEFVKFEGHEEKQPYFEFGDEDWPFSGIDRVLMFSGGLDSLAGAVQTAASGKNLVLVSHRPVTTQSKRQVELFKALRATFAVPMIHVPVWINKEEKKGKEHTQRTRSFLYSALGALVAASVRAGGVRFFENGIVSLNLPVADEALRARASRTTHPMVLKDFSRFYSVVLDREFEADNPFVFKTKTDVVSLIAEHGAEELVKLTCSCSHQGLFQSRNQWHCGTCSQCIDRRIAMVAAGLERCDPATDYVSDVFVGARKDGYERNMAVDYVRHAVELSRMSQQDMAARFNRELSQAVRPFSKRSEAAQRFVEMHQRHGSTVEQVLRQQLERHGGALLRGELDSSSMMAMVAGQRHLASIWENYAERIAELLRGGLPKACKSHKPKHEPHLQEICDGILRAQDGELIREFPFVRWGSGATKPDWSAEHMMLWVELKYVRKSEHIRQISEAIAADITKYGDCGRKVLFVVYDPSHLVTDEEAFARPIESRESMRLRFVR